MNQYTAKWTEKEDLIIKKWYGQSTYVDISHKLPGRTPTAVKSRARVLKLTNSRLWSEEDIDILKREYSVNSGICSLIPNHSWEQIKKMASKLGLKIKYGRSKFNHLFFDAWTEESSYLLGFIAADGYINLKSNRIEIALQKRDRELLEKFVAVMDSDQPIYEKKKCFVLHIPHYYMVDAIIKKLNVTNNKTFGLRSVNVPRKMFRHFLRGYFDGDGSLSKSSKQLRICGNFYFLDWLSDFITEFGVYKRVPKPRKGENVCDLSYCGKNAVKLAKLMYNSSNIYLARKYQRYVQHYSQSVYNAKCSTLIL